MTKKEWDIIYKLASEELGIPKDKIEYVYRMYWYSIKNHLESIDITKEEDLKRGSANVHLFGKFDIVKSKKITNK